MFAVRKVGKKYIASVPLGRWLSDTHTYIPAIATVVLVTYNPSICCWNIS